MTFTDTRMLFMDPEEIAECKKVETEEVKEDVEAEKNTEKHKFGGSATGIITDRHISTRATYFLLYHINSLEFSLQQQDVPLFLLYCCLKLAIA